MHEVQCFFFCVFVRCFVLGKNPNPRQFIRPQDNQPKILGNSYGAKTRNVVFTLFILKMLLFPKRQSFFFLIYIHNIQKNDQTWKKNNNFPESLSKSNNDCAHILMSKCPTPMNHWGIGTNNITNCQNQKLKNVHEVQILISVDFFTLCFAEPVSWNTFVLYHLGIETRIPER